jgi:hypothetical protein
MPGNIQQQSVCVCILFFPLNLSCVYILYQEKGYADDCVNNNIFNVNMYFEMITNSKQRQIFFKLCNMCQKTDCTYANIAPRPPKSRYPMMHSYRKAMPARWCGRRWVTRYGSTTTSTTDNDFLLCCHWNNKGSICKSVSGFQETDLLAFDKN